MIVACVFCVLRALYEGLAGSGASLSATLAALGALLGSPLSLLAALVGVVAWRGRKRSG